MSTGFEDGRGNHDNTLLQTTIQSSFKHSNCTLAKWLCSRCKVFFSNAFSVQNGEGLTFLVVDNNAFCKVFRVRHAPRISFRCRREKTIIINRITIVTIQIVPPYYSPEVDQSQTFDSTLKYNLYALLEDLFLNNDLDLMLSKQ